MSAALPPTISPITVPPVPGVRLGEVLGRGGFATVYAGEQLSLMRPVAVKVDSRMLHDERNRRRFQREMSAASRISGHPHAVSLIDAGVLGDGRPYLVMERCDGGSLVDVLDDGPLMAADAARIVEAVSSALGAAHAAGVLHRDIKPANILIDAYGAPRLSDFGIAAIEHDDRAASVTLETLTPEFAPPEAFQLAAPLPSGDVWSMGAVLLSLLTGRSPRSHSSGRPLSLPEIVASLSVPVETSDPRIPAPLRGVLDRSMDPDPARRYRDGGQLARALAELNGHLGRGAMAVAGPRATILLSAADPSAPAGSAGSALAPHAPPEAPAPTSSRARRTSGTMVLGLLMLGVVLGALVTSAVVVGVNAWRHSSLAAAQDQSPAAQQGAGATAQSPAGQAAAAQDGQQPQDATGSQDSQDPSAGRTAAPALVDEAGTPYSESMPWPVGACLNAEQSPVGGTSVQQVECAQAQWIVFAGGEFDPSTTAPTAAQALATDPQVQAVCTSQYAEHYGLDLTTSYEISTLAPSEEEWAAGERGFSCVYGRL